jgi:hypothetical protein
MTSSLAAKRRLRGGIDAGLGMLIADREVYGPALERAYALEAGEAEYCRTVIGDELWGYLTFAERPKLQSSRYEAVSVRCQCEETHL